MMYTNTRPTYQEDRIHLFPSLEAARAAGGCRRILYKVAVRFDPLERRVVPLWTHPSVIDRNWRVRAEAHADGSVTARGPIPTLLFTE
jgi:hypothetical protein